MKKSKVDAIIKRKEAEAEKRGEQRGKWAGVTEGRRLEREQNTLLMTPQEGAVLIGGLPEHQYVQVPVPQYARVANGRYSRDEGFSDRFRVPLAKFRAVQKCWTTGEGHKVAWFEWRFEGVS